jgi:hypothetical protein
MDQGVDKESICQACGKNELVFAGPNTTEHLSDKLTRTEYNQSYPYAAQVVATKEYIGIDEYRFGWFW